jgi:biofilm protein TabA
MIIGDLSNWELEKEWVLPSIRQALEWTVREIHADTPHGKYPIEGDQIFVNVQHLRTEPASERLSEAHREYIDIQLLLSGRESILVARDTGNNEIWADEMETRDRLTYKHVENESEIVLTPGMFAVFFPADIHRPCCSAGESMDIRKAVVKIHLSRL